MQWYFIKSNHTVNIEAKAMACKVEFLGLVSLCYKIYNQQEVAIQLVLLPRTGNTL